MTKMDQDEIVVSFKLGVEEARLQTAELQKSMGTTKASIRLQFTAAIAYLVLGIVEVATNHLRLSGWSYIVGGCAFAYLALSRRALIINVPAGVETTVRFTVEEIVFERPAPQTLPWSAVEGVDRFDGAMTLRFLVSEIQAPLEQRIVIPRDAFSDRGIAFWHLSERMLLGPLRRVSAQLSADETGALRRTDAAHIENIRARRVSTKRRRLPAQSVSPT